MWSRVLRDQWYAVKVDNASRTAVLNENAELRASAKRDDRERQRSEDRQTIVAQPEGLAKGVRIYGRV